MQPRLFHLHALSALHCGTGQSAGVVDLPIARARATNLPLVPGSSVRGVAREEVTGRDEQAAITLFGPARIDSDAQSFAGALAIGDAHLLALPVRALAGIVCFVTCPFILSRYRKDCEGAGLTVPVAAPKPKPGSALVPAGSVNCSDTMLVLEDLDLVGSQVGDGLAFPVARHQVEQDDLRVRGEGGGLLRGEEAASGQEDAQDGLHRGSHEILLVAGPRADAAETSRSTSARSSTRFEVGAAAVARSAP